LSYTDGVFVDAGSAITVDVMEEKFLSPLFGQKTDAWRMT